jgi:hypothetical protein
MSFAVEQDFDASVQALTARGWRGVKSSDIQGVEWAGAGAFRGDRRH